MLEAEALGEIHLEIGVVGCGVQELDEIERTVGGPRVI